MSPLGRGSFSYQEYNTNIRRHLLKDKDFEKRNAPRKRSFSSLRIVDSGPSHYGSSRVKSSITRQFLSFRRYRRSAFQIDRINFLTLIFGLILLAILTGIGIICCRLSVIETQLDALVSPLRIFLTHVSNSKAVHY